MVRSIRDFGIIIPIIVRMKGEFYEILPGHNRANADKAAGLKKVPGIIKENLEDEEAMLIVTETNLMQRSFSDMLHSERATALSKHHKALSSQG
jgi:ParB family chromosome partitioning protein